MFFFVMVILVIFIKLKNLVILVIISVLRDLVIVVVLETCLLYTKDILDIFLHVINFIP